MDTNKHLSESHIEKIIGKYSKYLDENAPDTTFKHVSRHLIQYTLLDENLKKDSIESLKKYISLLDRSPKFREDQLEKDIFPHGQNTNVIKYIEGVCSAYRKFDETADFINQERLKKS